MDLGLTDGMIVSGNTTNTMTGRRAPVVEEEEEEEGAEVGAAITRSGAGSAPDRSALETRVELVEASGEAG